MSIAAAHAAAFYKEVAATKIIWAIKDAGGFPAPITSNQRRSMPFWSSEKRALTVIKNVEAYSGFEPVSISWDIFCERWLPGLAADGLLTGINWSGSNAAGYDVEPEELRRNVDALLDKDI